MKIAMFDDYVPHVDLGAGLPRANAICNDLVTRVERFSYVAMHGPAGDAGPDDWYRDLDRRIDVHVPPLGVDWLPILQHFAREGFGILWVSRPPNAKAIFSALDREPGLRERLTVVYDAEALYAPRTIQRDRLMGQPMRDDAAAMLLAEEFSLAQRADVLVSVSPGEAEKLAAGTGRPTFVLGFPSLVEPSPAPFEARRDVGFVGPIRRSSPNEDSMLWYAANVMHEVYARTGARLRVAGLLESKLLNIYAGAECEMLGQVPALSQFMNEIRVFIAPTRFAAGLPQKLIDAASAGVPIVATSLLADQLGWTPGTDLLVADEPQAFADACQRLYHEGMLWGKLRRNARCRVNERYGAGCLTREVDDLMTSLSGITC